MENWLKLTGNEWVNWDLVAGVRDYPQGPTELPAGNIAVVRRLPDITDSRTRPTGEHVELVFSSGEYRYYTGKDRLLILAWLDRVEDEVR